MGKWIIRGIVGIVAVVIIGYGVKTARDFFSPYDKGSELKGRYEALNAEYANYKAKEEKRIEELQRQILILEEAKANLMIEVDEKTKTIRQVRMTITDLEKAREGLTDLNDIIYNQNLQIQEYKKMVRDQEKRYLDLKQAFLYLESEKNMAVEMAKTYKGLLQKERRLRTVAEERLGVFEKKNRFQGLQLNIGKGLVTVLGGALLYCMVTK